MTVTSLGKLLRKWRIDKGVTMYDMAKDMNVSSSFLSSIERGKKKVNATIIESIKNYFELDEQNHKNLLHEINITNEEIKLNYYDSDVKESILAFSKIYSDLSETQKEQIKRMLNKE